MMNMGAALLHTIEQQDTETTRPELTEQQRIRLKEEELGGQESVHMAGSETEYAAPGLNTLEPECETAHSGGNDTRHTDTSLIKTETDLDPANTGESLYFVKLSPDQIKTETDDGGYIKSENTWHGITSEKLKYETIEVLVTDLMGTESNGAGDHTGPTESWQCVGEPSPNGRDLENEQYPASIMSKLRAKHGNCSVVGCTDQHNKLHRLPASEDRRAEWMNFIFDGNVPAAVGKNIYVCANHFQSDCFTNLGQYKAGLATKLFLTVDSVPTVRDKTLDEASASTSLQLRTTTDFGCQTDPPETATVGTQLALRTLRPPVKSEAVQATVSCRDFGVGEATIPYVDPPPAKRARLDLEEEEEEEEERYSFEDSSSSEEEELDSTYDPAESVTASSESSSSDMSDVAPNPTHKMKKYIVYESCIMELFEVCPVCQRACDVRTQRFGTFLSVEQLCPHCQFSRHWKSQPLLGSTPAGNLHLSAAVYVSGASFFQLEKIFKAMRLQIFNYDTFHRHARMFIEPAIVKKWKTSQDVMLRRLSEEDKVTVGMSADSLGQTARFGSYTMMDLKTRTVVDIQLFQSNKVGGGYHVEKESLQRSVALLDAWGVTLDCVVTDRHPQIQTFLRESNITQFCDVSHMEKGISKQLEKIIKMKDCGKLQRWLHSIRNHIYWTASSSKTGLERVAKWTSFLNHVRDIHRHEDRIFPKCIHPVRQTREETKWLEAATPAFYKLEKVWTNKEILKDVAELSPHQQTSSLEAFHRIILRFAPKDVVFPFIGMLCRLYLAALHYNENVDRLQIASAGEPLPKVDVPKTRRGESRAKLVKTEPTFRYVDDLMDLIFEEVVVDPAPYTDEVLNIPVPDDLSAQYKQRDEEEVIASCVSRLNQGGAV